MPEIAQIGIISRLQGEATDDSLPRYYPADGWLDRDTLFLFDAGKTASWPSQADPANGASVINLVEGGSVSTVLKTGANITFRENGFSLPGLGNNFIRAATATQYELAEMGNPDVLYIIWIKRETGYSTASYQCVIGRGSNTVAGNYEFYINLGPAGDQPGFAFSTSSLNVSRVLTGAPLTSFQGALLNTTVQLAVAQEGGRTKAFLNGVLAAETDVLFTKPYNNINSDMYIGNGVGGNAGKFLVKRWGMTKLTTKTAAERVLQDYTMNVARMTATD